MPAQYMSGCCNTLVILIFLSVHRFLQLLLLSSLNKEHTVMAM